MVLRQLYETSVRPGIALAPRGPSLREAHLARVRQEFGALPARRRPNFDQERHRNPFGDVRLLVGPEDVDAHTILLGTTIGLPELLSADHLREHGTRVDAVIAHHTTNMGKPRAAR